MSLVANSPLREKHCVPAHGCAVAGQKTPRVQFLGTAPRRSTAPTAAAAQVLPTCLPL